MGVYSARGGAAVSRAHRADDGLAVVVVIDAARAHAVVVSVLTPTEVLVAARRLAGARPHLAAVAGIVHPRTRGSCAAMSSPESTSASTAGHPRPPVRRRRGGHAGDRGTATRRDDPMARDRHPDHRANTAAHADPDRTRLDRREHQSAALNTIVNSGGPATSSRAPAAPPRSRKKSSPATLVCSLTRSFTKSVHPVPNAMLGGILESAVSGKSVPGSGGTCSRVPTGHAAGTCEQGGLPDLLARGRHGHVHGDLGRRAAGVWPRQCWWGAALASAELLWPAVRLRASMR